MDANHADAHVLLVIAQAALTVLLGVVAFFFTRYIRGNDETTKNILERLGGLEVKVQALESVQPIPLKEVQRVTDALTELAQALRSESRQIIARLAQAEEHATIRSERLVKVEAMLGHLQEEVNRLRR